MKRTIVNVTVLAVALVAAGSVLAVEVTEDFSGDPGWEGVNNRPGDGLLSDFGYSATGNAGGAIGEGGGVISRSGTPPQSDGSQPPVAYYAADLGAQLTLDQPFQASGVASLTNNGNIFLGFFDSANPCFSSLCDGGGGRMQATAMGWLVDFASTYMVAGVPGGGWVISSGFPATPGGQFAWDMAYDPDAGANGQLTGNLGPITGVTIDISAGARSGGAVFDRFGLAGGTDNVLDPGSYPCCVGTGPLYIDDVTYTIPEPAALSVLACGGLLMLRRRRA